MNFRTVSTLLFVLLFAGGAPASPVPYIIGGTDATNGEFPFMVALVDPAVTSSDLAARFCGGTIIAPHWVLTAGHCVSDAVGVLKPAASIEVIAGVTTLDYLSASATRLPVDAIIRHPAFDDAALLNDIALLHLPATLAPSALFATDDDSLTAGLLAGDDVTAIGWGLTRQDDPATPANEATVSPVLQKAVLDYIPYATCNDHAHYDGLLPATAICAGYQSGLPRDSCFGDSGGPLLLAVGGGAWRQVGVTSFGDSSGCAQVRYPGAYTRVGLFTDFIAGAQAQPDLRVVVDIVPGTAINRDLTMRATVYNDSPLVTATGVTLSVARDRGIYIITGTGGALSCIGFAGARDCTVGDLAPQASASVDVTLEFPNSGTYALRGTASSTNGDYYPPDNTDAQSYTLGHVHGGGGGIPPGALVLLAGALALRRR